MITTEMEGTFFDACTKGDLARVNEFLLRGYSPDEKGHWNETPLTVSARAGHHSVVSHLITSGARVNKIGWCNKTPLRNAIEGRHLMIVEMLLNAGAKIDEVDKYHFTPLMLATENGYHDIVSQLITSGADISKKDKYERTALHEASKKGHLKIVETLLNAGAKIDEVDLECFTPLMWAAANGHHDVVSHLITVGADINKKGQYGRVALHFASENAHLIVVDMLLDAGAEIDEVDEALLTPLMLATCRGHVGIVSHLLEAGSDVTKRDHEGRSVLHVAVQSMTDGTREMNFSMFEVLLNAGVKTDEVDNKQCTPLMLAAGRGHVSIVNHLLGDGVDVNKQNCDGQAALHFAATNWGHHQLEIVKMLLSKGAEVDLEDKHHCTPLVLSAMKTNKDYDVIFYLMEFGADVTQFAKHFNKDLGREVLSDMVIYKYVELAKNFITKGVGIEGFLSTSPPITALMWTAQEGDNSLTKELILQGVNVNYQNPDDFTALHFSAQHNHIQCGILLVEAGADVSIVNKASQTPLDLSSKEFKDAILQTLSFQTKKTVCVIGNAMSGKSTLIASLQNENAGFVKKICNRLFGVRDISERTAGIEPVSLSSKRYGDVMFFDFAGQHEYHGPHEMFLESILSKGLSTVTIIVVVKATEEESAICHQLNRWLHPFTKLSSSVNPVRVIVIGSYMDKVKHKVGAKEKLDLCYRRVKNSVRGVPLKFGDPCYLDCRRPYASDIYKLCAYLSDVPPPQYKARDTAYSICWVISRMRSSFEDKVISVSEFSDWIASNKANLPTNLPPAEEVCKDLSSTGHFLYLPSKEGTSNGWLVLDLPSVLHKVYGTLFSPLKKIVNKFGLLNCQRLSVLFPTLDPSMIRDFLISLEFCVEVDPSILSESTHLMDNSDEGHEHLFFPALVAASPPKVFTENREGRHILCWQLEASEDSFLSPHLLQTIILRLAAHHVFHHKRGSETREHYCSVWSNGIFWQSLSVDVAVEISNNAVVQVIGRSEVSPEILCTNVSTIIEDIFGTIHNMSPHLSGGTYMIHPVNPQALLENPRSPSPQEMFPVEFILESRRNDKKGCLSCKRKEERAVRKLISDIFCGFEPSVDVIKPFQMPSCKCTCARVCVHVCVCVCACVCVCVLECIYQAYLDRHYLVCMLFYCSLKSLFPFLDPPKQTQPPTYQPTGSTTSTNPLPTASSDPLPTMLDEPLRTTPTDPLLNSSGDPLSRPSKADSDPLPTTFFDPLKTTPTDPLLTTPTINKLQQLLVQDIALDWFSVGLQLDIKVSVLNIIEADVYPRSVERCCRTMFTRWLACDEGTGGEPRVWRTVLKALKNVGYMALVGDVERTLFEQK